MANISPHQQPGYVDKDTTNNNGNTAQAFRYAAGALSQPAPAQTFQWAAGVFPGDSNAASITDYLVSQATPSANMTVLVQPGQLIINRASGGPYIGTSNAAFSVTIPASNTNPRIDYVCMRVRDLGIDGVGSSVRTYDAVVLSGTPGGSPAEPVGQLTDGDTVLAAVTVRANTTSILNSDISDRRIFVAAQGGIYPMSALDTRIGAYPGQVRYNMNNKNYEGWDGTAWLVIASPAVWSSWSPVLHCNGAGGISAGTVNLGTGGTVVGRYLQQGKRLDIAYTFTWGSAGFSAGAGPINTTLPPGFVSRNLGETHIPCLWYSGSVTKTVWAGLCYIGPNSNGLAPRFPISAANASIWELAAQGYGGVTGVGTGTPNIPGAFSDGPAAVLTIAGTIEIQ
jgi:hypothetical protein